MYTTLKHHQVATSAMKKIIYFHVYHYSYNNEEKYKFLSYNGM